MQGRGRFTGPNTLAVEGGEDGQLQARGHRHAARAPARPPVDGIDHPRCVDSTGMLAVSEVPKRLVVLGGGVIGCEFASIFAHFGIEVTIVEMLDHLIPMEDADAINALERAFKKRGITVHTGAKATRVEETGDGMVLHYEGKDGGERGRRPT